MTPHAHTLRQRLAAGPSSGSQIAAELGLSQPTVTRALAAMGEEVLKVGQRKSTRYYLRDQARGLGAVPVYRVDAAGRLSEHGTLTPVRPEGYVFTLPSGMQHHSEGTPWWLLDALPQGFLGRAYALRYGPGLGLPSSLKEWTDSHAMRALLAHGHDLVGNLMVGADAREKFLAAPPPKAIEGRDKPATYARLAELAAQGDSPGSSAGGEQPKFTTYAEFGSTARHVIVKFSEPQAGPNSARWRDLLLAEHLALEALRGAGVPAARSHTFDHQGQRFLEVERFDRVGALGRKAVVSLGALDAEFAGLAPMPWPVITKSLARRGVITQQAAQVAEVLWAFGSLIGNSDMHNGNLSFTGEQGESYEVAPAYDMSPMSFAPTSAGRLPDSISPSTPHPSVSNEGWRTAQQIATKYLSTLKRADQLGTDFRACLDALGAHLSRASEQISRLA